MARVKQAAKAIKLAKPRKTQQLQQQLLLDALARLAEVVDRLTSVVANLDDMKRRIVALEARPNWPAPIQPYVPPWPNQKITFPPPQVIEPPVYPFPFQTPPVYEPFRYQSNDWQFSPVQTTITATPDLPNNGCLISSDFHS